MLLLLLLLLVMLLMDGRGRNENGIFWFVVYRRYCSFLPGSSIEMDASYTVTTQSGAQLFCLVVLSRPIVVFCRLLHPFISFIIIIIIIHQAVTAIIGVITTGGCSL
jgi:hypothetical protein